MLVLTGTLKKSYLLGVSRSAEPRKVAVGVHCAKEDGFELVHARVGEQQRWVRMRHHAAGRHDRVPPVAKELQERLPHTVPCTERKR